jgi:hypothetical protein
MEGGGGKRGSISQLHQKNGKYLKSLITGTYTYTPVAKKGSTKYGNQRRCSSLMLEGFNLSERSAAVLLDVGDHGLAKSTWSTYSTAQRMLAKCAKETGKKMELPLSQADLLEYIGWLISERNVKAGTVNSYLSGLRQLHILKGMDPPNMRSGLVRLLLQGKKNMDNIQTRKEDQVKRLPITMNVMRLLKEEIRRWPVALDQKLLTWAIATVAFHGAFRIHELLCRTEAVFDPDFTLLTDDIKVVQEHSNTESKALEVKLKCPKESKAGKSVIIEIFETKGTLCPVKAFERWKRTSTRRPGQPAFCDRTGRPVTGSKMNTWLKTLLGKHVDYKKGKFTGHSFRIGLATTLGALGFTTDDIKEAGRWSSSAYEVYMRLPRRRRRTVARLITELDRQL